MTQSSLSVLCGIGGGGDKGSGREGDVFRYRCPKKKKGIVYAGGKQRENKKVHVGLWFSDVQCLS